MLLAQHDDDQDVGEEGDRLREGEALVKDDDDGVAPPSTSYTHQDDRHDVAVDGDGQGRRAVPGGAVNVVAASLVPTFAKWVQLWRNQVNVCTMYVTLVLAMYLLLFHSIAICSL